jgi:hypothetical protein
MTEYRSYLVLPSAVAAKSIESDFCQKLLCFVAESVDEIDPQIETLGSFYDWKKARYVFVKRMADICLTLREPRPGFEPIVSKSFSVLIQKPISLSATTISIMTF